MAANLIDKEDKQPNVNLDSREKALLLEIIKEADGGKVMRILAEGPSANQLKADIWKRIQHTFFIETGRKVIVEKLRKQYSRLKLKEKKTHDDKIQKNFTKSCSTTGGGVGPSPPPEYDGDEFDEEMMSGVILDPTSTPFNTLTKPKDKRVRVLMPRQGVEEQEIVSSCSQPSHPPSTPSHRESASSSSPASLYRSGPGGTTRTSTSPAPLPHSGPGRGIPRPFLSGDSPRRSASPSFFSTRPRSSSGVESPVTSRGSPAAPSLPDISARSRESSPTGVTEEVFITNTTTGERSTVRPEYVTQDSNNNAKAKKGKAGSKKDVINAGAEYYTEMLAKQTELMKLRMKLLKSKYKNEKLKQVVLKNQISTLGIQIEESSESSSDSEDSNDEMDD